MSENTVNYVSPQRGPSAAYGDYVSNHEMPMIKAGCSMEQRSQINRMKLSHDGEWVAVYFRQSNNTEKLLGTEYYKFSQGPNGINIARESFDRRFPHLVNKYTICHE